MTCTTSRRFEIFCDGSLRFDIPTAGKTVIEADAILEPARRRGFEFFTGVPCSFLAPFINRVISDPTLAYVGATSEGEAVAIAAGAWLAGRTSVVMCQYS